MQSLISATAVFSLYMFLAGYEEWAAKQDPRRQWTRCLIDYLLAARVESGPVTYSVALDEAQAACIEYRTGWYELVEERGGSFGASENDLEDALRSAWELDLPDEPQQ